MESRVSDAPVEDQEIEDDRLRLISTCCYPALPPEAQVALTLLNRKNDEEVIAGSRGAT